LAVELDEVGYFDLHDDPDLLLKCCAAVVRNDASARTIIDLKGAEVRDAFATFRTGLLGAIAHDIAAVQQLLAGNTSEFDKRSIVVEPDFFIKNQFSLNSVNTKVFILLLAQAKPKSFLSAADVDLDDVLLTCNRTEFHHIFPKNHLTLNGFVDKKDQFVLANFAFLSQKDNRSIQDKAPSDYARMMPPGTKDAILAASLIPLAGLDADYKVFIEDRARLLADAANKLVA